MLGGEKVVSNSVVRSVRFANEVSKEDAVYIGNRNTMKFHYPDCRVLPDEKNQVYFEMRHDATSQGFDPCGVCKP